MELVVDNAGKRDEKAFRSWISDRIPGWRSFIEPAYGSTTGIPDMLVILPTCRQILPVELKVGTYIQEKFFDINEPGGPGSVPDVQARVRPTRLRATQVKWHDDLARAGGQSCILIGVPEGVSGWTGYALMDCRLKNTSNWRAGIPMSKLILVIRHDQFRLGDWTAAMRA